MYITDIIKKFKLRIMKSAPRGFAKVKYGNGKNQFILIKIKKGMAEAQILNTANRKIEALLRAREIAIKKKYNAIIKKAKSKPEKQVLKAQMTNDMQKMTPQQLTQLIRDKTILENLSKTQKKEVEILQEQKAEVSKQKQQALSEKQQAISEKQQAEKEKAEAEKEKAEAEKEKDLFKNLRIEYKRLKKYAENIALPYSIIYKFHKGSSKFEDTNGPTNMTKKEGIIKFLNSPDSAGFKNILKDAYKINTIKEIEEKFGGKNREKRRKYDDFKRDVHNELAQYMKLDKTPEQIENIRVAHLKEEYDKGFANLSNDKALKETLTNVIEKDMDKFWADVGLINVLDDDPTNNNQEVAEQLIQLVPADGERADAEPAGPLVDDQNAMGYLSKAQLNGGLYESEINNVMNKYGDYMGTFAIDELKDALNKVNKQSRGSLIINLSPRGQTGSHWVACYFDARPDHKNAIEYYDSFANEPHKLINQFIKILADRLDAKTYIPLKINFVKQQNDDSYNCGYWCMNFLINRYNNRPYSEATFYDERSKEDDTIRKFERKYVESFGAGITWDKFKEGVKSFFAELKRRLDAFFRDIHKFNPALKRILTDNLDPVVGIQVVRQPIQKAVAGLLNFLSGGQIDQNLIKNGYDSVFHLSALIKTKNPETGEENIYKTQKNPQVELKKVPANFWLNESQQGQIVAGVKREFRNIQVNKKITIGEMFEALLKKYDETVVAKYTTDYNCQWFITELLKASNLGNSILYDWILQDINKIFDANLTNLKKTSDIITNFKARLDTLFKGAGKEPKAKKPVAILIKEKTYGKKQIKEILNKASYKPVVKTERLNGYIVNYYTDKPIKNKTYKKYDNNKVIMVYNR